MEVIVCKAPNGVHGSIHRSIRASVIIQFHQRSGEL